MGRRWQGWILPARWHFTRKTLHLLLLRCGFHRVWLRDLGRAQRLQTPLGRVLASAELAPQRPRPSLSIIVPVFNEAATCATLLDRLLAKELPGLDKEVVIVESNSTDGTRTIVEGYDGRPGVHVVLEDRPRGKGHAVRAGLSCASGDFVLIQDGDLEYDLDDYESLLEPLARWEALFVLGSRHTGHWKMRVFNDAPVTAAVFNLGQVFYTGLVNLVLRTAMTDPFTMFKVFRRDCLHGLALSGRRFDFDFELVMKLVRKGYIPLELPVNYTARSFAEGKKVSFVRDGLTWVWVVAKYGFGPLGPGDHDRFRGVLPS
ncbi:MAG: glycosyltransferase family 2 protein [Acidobacteria bacterium]|nr:glycosyltransferase family 2 protein [Acidobacteriota bacterium]